jgi:hypothetical protein
VAIGKVRTGDSYASFRSHELLVEVGLLAFYNLLHPVLEDEAKSTRVLVEKRFLSFA